MRNRKDTRTFLLTGLMSLSRVVGATSGEAPRAGALREPTTSAPLTELSRPDLRLMPRDGGSTFAAAARAIVPRRNPPPVLVAQTHL